MFVAIAVLILRKREAARKRHFTVPMVWLVAPLTILGCVFLFFNLPYQAMLFLPVLGRDRPAGLFRVQPTQQPSGQRYRRGRR